MHYYQFNISDYQSHTKHLTPIEDICYRRLLDWQYLHEKPIPNDINVICRLLMLNGCSTDVERMLNEFFELVEQGWINKRAFVEIEAFRIKTQKASEAGKASAAKRNKKKDVNNQEESDIQRPLNDRSTTVQPTINHKPLTINHKTEEEKINKKEKSDLFFDVTDQTQSDFKKLRLAKKAPITERAITAIRLEATKAGISLETALIECCARGWAGFKAEWYIKTHAPPANAPNKADALLNKNRLAVQDWMPPEMRNANE